VIGRVSIVSASICNGGFALNGLIMNLIM